MKKLLVLFIILVFMSSCLDEEQEGINSLRGDWTVVDIQSRYAEFTEFGRGEILDFADESGNLGSFNFADKLVTFDFTRNDTIYNGTNEWKLDACKQRVGFVRETVFSLDIKNEFFFDVRFSGENEGRKSVKNAKYVTLSQRPSEPGFGVSIVLMLEKD